MSKLNYYINGTLLRSIGVYITESNGWRGLPKPKTATSESWADRSGEFVYGTAHQLYEAREITLKCVIIATPTQAVQKNAQSLITLLTNTSKPMLRLEVERSEVGRLAFDVYRTDSIVIDNKHEEAYTCTIKLKEPQPQATTLIL